MPSVPGEAVSAHWVACLGSPPSSPGPWLLYLAVQNCPSCTFSGGWAETAAPQRRASCEGAPCLGSISLPWTWGRNVLEVLVSRITVSLHPEQWCTVCDSSWLPAGRLTTKFGAVLADVEDMWWLSSHPWSSLGNLGQVLRWAGSPYPDFVLSATATTFMPCSNFHAFVFLLPNFLDYSFHLVCILVKLS